MVLRKRQRLMPRGIRNNNPLNIRIGNVWLGEVDSPTDPEFEQFCSMEYGLRAAFIILRRYIRRYGHNTIRAIISTWAPDTENNTTTYVNSVADRLNMSPDETIKYEDQKIMCKLVSAMCQVECGENVSETIINKAYNMA